MSQAPQPVERGLLPLSAPVAAGGFMPRIRFKSTGPGGISSRLGRKAGAATASRLRGKTEPFQSLARRLADRAASPRGRVAPDFVSNSPLKPLFRLYSAHSLPGRSDLRIGRVGPGQSGGQSGMDVILHLGAHRTATTSLQAWMVQNEDALRAGGIAVWGPSVTRAGLFAGLMKRPDLITAQDEREARASSTAIRFEIDRLEEAGTRALVISEENFLGTMLHCVAEQTLYPDAAGRLKRVVAALGPHLTGLALTIRRYDTWWSSVLADQRARGRAVPEPRGLDRLAEHPRGWKRLVQILRDEGQGRPVTVWPFETMVGRNAGQMRLLLGATPLPGGLYDHGRAMNATPPAAARVAPFKLAQRGAMAARYLDDLTWLATPRPGLRFIENDATSPGAHPGGLTEKEGTFHDHENTGLGQARSEGAA